MTLSARIEVLKQLGDHLLQGDEFLDALISRTHYNNQWLTAENYQMRVKAFTKAYLQQEALAKVVSQYDLSVISTSQKVAIILSGQIPLAGVEDIITTFLVGHQAQIKLSPDDKFVLPYLVKLLVNIDPACARYFEVVEKLHGFTAVIANATQKSLQAYQNYFGKYPHLIRQPKNSVAILNGQEHRLQLDKLGADVFQYFGLSQKSVAKIYVPKHYNFTPLLEALHEYKHLVLNTKYKNNFDYNYSLYLLNKIPMYNNGCIILTENKVLQSRIAGVHYEYYEDINDVEIDLFQQKAAIYQVVATPKLLNRKTVGFGQAHQLSFDQEACRAVFQFLSDLKA